MLTIENEEELVETLIRKDFEKEILHTEKMFELFMKSYSFICTHEQELLTKEDYAKWSVFVLFIRNFRILRSAYHSMFKGYYEVSIAVQRMAFENHLLMFYFMHREDEARKWWFGKRFKPRFLKKEVQERLSYKEVYGSLSEFVHANFKTTRFFWKPKGKETTIWTTDYVQEDFFRALHGILTFGVATLLITIPTIFNGKFKEEPLLKNIMDFADLNKLVLKDAWKRVRSTQTSKQME